MTPPILQAIKLTKRYPAGPRRQDTVLQEVSLTVQRGEVVSIIGVNGAGKTTLLKLLSGLVQPTSGTAMIAGRMATDPRARRELGFSPENPFFYPEITARRWLHFVGELYRWPASQRQAATDRWLLAVKLTAAADRPLYTYSKGMRARLAFAQAALTDPAILLLDEPLDGLDPVGRHELKEQLLRLKRAGTAIVICSHILSDLESVSDRIGVLHRHCLRDLLTTRRFIGRAPSLEAAFINHLRRDPAG